jgi:hypothetical protein
MLFVPHASQQFAFRASNHTTRPSTTFGTSVTPGNNTMGGWQQLLSGATVAQDVFGIMIQINNGSGASRDILVDIGVDPAGGSSYSVVIPYLIGSCAGANGFGGIWYYFPLWIRAGSSIAARASVNNATVGTVRVYAKVFGQPQNPENIKVGTYVDAHGITTGTSNGTAITSGTTSEGAWTTLNASTTRQAWWWQMGFGINNGTITALVWSMDLGIGDGSNKAVVIEDLIAYTDTSERINYANPAMGCEFDTPAGSGVYGRLQCSGTVVTGLSVAAWSLGG